MRPSTASACTTKSMARSDGVPLVLLHGGGSTIDVTFSRVLPVFARNRRVIAVEEQGHGRTSDRDAPVRFESSADDVAALLTHLKVPLADLRPAVTRIQDTPRTHTQQLQEIEREQILTALRDAGGVIAGTSGAAARLWIKRTMLQSRMQKLGIVRPSF